MAFTTDIWLKAAEIRIFETDIKVLEPACTSLAMCAILLATLSQDHATWLRGAKTVMLVDAWIGVANSLGAIPPAIFSLGPPASCRLF